MEENAWLTHISLPGTAQEIICLGWMGFLMKMCVGLGLNTGNGGLHFGTDQRFFEGFFQI